MGKLFGRKKKYSDDEYEDQEKDEDEAHKSNDH